MKIGIVGLPNAGKSTIFNALCNGNARVENYPFTTIEPNVGVVDVPDSRLSDIAEIFKPDKVIPTSIQFLDIAGLVKGASQGEGLGNKFLGNIRETDAVAQIVRYFSDPDVVHNYGDVDPKRDIEIINTELLLSDLEIVERNLNAKMKERTPESKAICEFLAKIQEFLKKGVMLNKAELNSEEITLAKQYGLLTYKPALYVLNVGEEDIGKEIKVAPEIDFVTICGKWESELLELSEESRSEFMRDMNVTELGLHKLVKAGYKTLGLVTFFTTESKEVKAWTVKNGEKAPGAAGKIHTDMEKGFIRAEVVNYDTLMKYKDLGKVREHGLLRMEGKECTVCDGDVIKFHFN